MMFSGRSMGGGRGGGGMLRNFGRAVTRVAVSGNGIQEPSSSSSSTTASPARRSKSPTCLSLPPPVNCHAQNPVSGLPFHCSSLEVDGFDWVTVDGFEDEGFNGFSGSYVLGNVPSEQEVDDAIFSLQRVFCSTAHFQLNNDDHGLKNDVADNIAVPGLHVTTNGSAMDWKEPSISPYDTRMRNSGGSDGVYYAFHLLQTEPTVQKMVKSLSTDKAVWNAVMNNEAVRELQESFSSGSSDWFRNDDEKISQTSDETSIGSESHSTTNVVMRIFNSSKAKITELIEKITKIVTNLFQAAFHKRDEEAGFPDPFSEKLRTSFMLSIIVLLIVVVGRAKMA